MKELSVQRYREDIERDLGALIAIPSVDTDPLPGMPFGEAPARAIEFIVERAKQLGLAARNFDNYACDVTWGDEADGDYAAVLVHVDVVPAGEGWTSDPFTAVRRGSRIYGRGSNDDKGPAIAALYCLKALADAGVKGKRPVRVIFGASEETGMADMEHYFAVNPLPSMGFSPDADYPICNREKGIMDLRIDGEGTGDILSCSAGTAYNVVPPKGVFRLRSADPAADAAALRRTADSGKFVQPDLSFDIDAEDGAVCVTAHGRPAHGSRPADGLSAAIWGLRLIADTFGEEKIGKFPAFILAGTAAPNGAGFGVDISDEPSGDLTMNLGIFEVENGRGTAKIDVRYPVTADGKIVTDRVGKAAAEQGYAFKCEHHDEPLYVPESHPLIGLLARAYEDIVGEPAKTYSMGGGTYARTLKNCGVAFGPIFPDAPDSSGNMHSADEFMDFDALMRHTEVCVRAMAALMQADL